uniref:Reverse transcriptase N-terminal domain-containing protein n=1 Tax=Nitophyllum punctatum TaxID=158729 RepID=A0A4D6WVZ2_9FLOR|nr:hypothetical protein [Nitophyllum punctatum]
MRLHNKLMTLNSNTLWVDMPWKKIQNKIFIIQSKIYKATREYKLNKVSKLQNYLINSHEAKILSIKIILSEFKLHKCINLNKYLIDDYSKFIIFKSLFKFEIKSYSLYLNLIINKIKQYIINLSMKPEWEAKFPRNFTQSEFLNLFKVIVNNNNKIIKKIFLKKILKKTQNKYCDNIANDFFIHMSKHITKISENIYQNYKYTNYYNNYLLLINIFLLDYLWYKIYLQKVRDYNVNVILLKSYLNELYKFTLNDLEAIIGKENHFNKIYSIIIKNKKHISDKTLSILIILFNIFCTSIYHYDKTINDLYLLINLSIYSNIRKKCKYVKFNQKSNIENNFMLNIFLYIHKIRHLYFHWY